jgi:hypothetical protein
MIFFLWFGLPLCAALIGAISRGDTQTIMVILVIIAALLLGGWLLFREKKEDRLVRETREAERQKTAEAERLDREKADAERRAREMEKQTERDNIDYIRGALHVPPMQIKAEFAKLFDGERLETALRAWGSYMHQSRSAPHNNKFKFAKIERFGNPATAEEARIAAERVRIAAQIAVIQKYTKGR